MSVPHPSSTSMDLTNQLRNLIDGTGKFGLGGWVRKKNGSNWHGRIVGFYTTDLTENGYVIESHFEEGSCQLYPESALEAWYPDGL